MTAAPPIETESRTRPALRACGGILASRWTWIAISILWAAAYAVSDRYTMNPDGMSYIDIAQNTVRGGPAQLINGYWSPGYPSLIALFLWIFRPSGVAVYPVVHALNLIIFMGVLGCFAFFLKPWLAGQSGEAKRHWVPFAYCVFLWNMIELIGMAAVTPDLCVAGVCFLAAGIAGRLSLANNSARHYAALGAVLGLGYYFKAAMLPLGLICLAVLWIWPPSSRMSRRGIVASGAVFLVLATPLAALLSQREGRFTTGEAGRLAYAWSVNRLRMTGWTEPGIHGTPRHPPRRLLEQPLVLEFEEPVRATFPLWYDPTYWYAGVKVRFDPQQQLATLNTEASLYGDTLRFMNGFVAGALLLGVLIVRDRRFAALDRRWRWQLAWPLAAAFMYAFIYMEPRYLAALFVIFWLAVYGMMAPRVNPTALHVILVTVAASMLAPRAFVAVTVVRQTVLDRASPPDYSKIVAQLRDLGLRPGELCAVVGDGSDAYYAQAGGFRIIAEIPDSEEFWRLSPSQTERALQVLSSAGVRALVAKNRPAGSASPAWRDVVGSTGDRYGILALPAR